MLNTESRLTALLVWLASLALCVWAAWAYLALPPPRQVWSDIAGSPLAEWLWRNQVMVTGLGGFAALALAYLFNGWRDRAERRHALERAEQRLSAVLAREADAIAVALADLEQRLASGATPSAVRGLVAEIVDPRDRVVLSATIGELARLGPGAVAALEALRRSARRLEALAAASDPPQERALARAVAAVATSAQDARHVLEIHAQEGPARADRLRLLPSLSDRGGNGSDSPPRLLPAA